MMKQKHYCLFIFPEKGKIEEMREKEKENLENIGLGNSV
jgi:hypothetical protein